MDPDACRALEDEERRLLQQGQRLSGERRRFKLRGRERWVSVTKTPILNRSGSPVALVSIERDVSERVRQEEQLRRSEAQLRRLNQILNSILDDMGEGVVVLDRDEQFMLFNKQAEALLGPPQRGLPRQLWAAHYGLFQRDSSSLLTPEENPMLRAMAGERVPETEIVVKNDRMDGANVAVSATPLDDAAIGLSGGIVLLRDVTSQRSLEEQLTQAQKMEAIGLLAGGVAHDFNNLLAVILSYGELVYQALPVEQRARDDVAEMLAAARRAASLTRQLLAFSRRQVAQPTVLDLNTVVAATEKMLRRVLGVNIELVTQLDATFSCHADRGQLEQIVLNLAVNARDAMPNGGKLTLQTRDVRLAGAFADSRGLVAGDHVALSVKDEGVGMDVATQKRIFEPFFTTKGVGQGTGLGLSTVYGLIRQAGGHIEVKSALGQGAEFTLYLRRCHHPGSEEAPPPHLTSAPAPHGLVLLLEDEDAVRRITARILREHGYEVFEARNAAEAREGFEQHRSRIILLLTDIAMPDVSGPDFAAELMRAGGEFHTLYMSGYHGEAISGHRLPPGAMLLGKPFTPAGLIQMVRDVLEPSARKN